MPPTWRGWTFQRALAAGALTLGALAMIAGEPSRGARGQIDVAALARAVEHEEDHVSALELARLIRARTPGLRIIDLRSAEEFGEYQIPGAERMSLTELTQRPFDRDSTIVLYSEGGTHAAQGWFLLKARGLDRVYFLRGGVFEWVDEIMEARIAPDATQAERDAFREVAELSRYFGGQPSVSDRPRSVLDEIAIPRLADSTTGPLNTGRQATRRLRRRGC
jgi:rhodanese-related sulfurtransferase